MRHGGRVRILAVLQQDRKGSDAGQTMEQDLTVDATDE